MKCLIRVNVYISLLSLKVLKSLIFVRISFFRVFDGTWHCMMLLVLCCIVTSMICTGTCVCVCVWFVLYIGTHVHWLLCVVYFWFIVLLQQSSYMWIILKTTHPSVPLWQTLALLGCMQHTWHLSHELGKVKYHR